MSNTNPQAENRPAEFHRLLGAPRHRLFAIFDDPSEGTKAIEALTSQGLARDEDIWEFYGDEGSRRLDTSGAQHGVHGRVVRFFQWMMSDDYEYLQDLDKALHRGGSVLAVRTEGEETIHRTIDVFDAHSGHAMKYCWHWDYTPV